MRKIIIFILLNMTIFSTSKISNLDIEKHLKEEILSGDIYAMNKLGFFYVEQNKLLEGEKYYKIAADKGSINAMNNLGNLYTSQNKLLEAEKYFKMAENNGDHTALYKIANIYFIQNKLPEAEKYYSIGITMENLLNIPTGIHFSNNERIPYADSDALNNLAVIYFIQNKLLEAEEYYKKAIDKDHVTALYNLGVLYEFQNKLLEAEKYFKMAVNKGDINAKEALERIKKLNNMD